MGVRSWKVGGVLALCYAGMLAGASLRQPASAQGEAQWHTDYAAARAAARQAGKPLFVVFR